MKLDHQAERLSSGDEQEKNRREEQAIFSYAIQALLRRMLVDGRSVVTAR